MEHLALKKFRFIAWGAVLVLSAVLAWNYANKQMSSLNEAQPGIAKFGSDFNLIKTDGTPINGKDFRGRPHLVFFGFTNCPEICPTTLFEATNWMETLGAQAKDLDIYFITVDPERDTPEFLVEYLTPFDKRIIGLSGSLEEIDKAAKSYHVYYRKVKLDDGDYTLDHTASIFMMKADGSFMGTIAYQENEETVLDKLKRLLDK